MHWRYMDFVKCVTKHMIGNLKIEKCFSFLKRNNIISFLNLLPSWWGHYIGTRVKKLTHIFKSPSFRVLLFQNKYTVIQHQPCIATSQPAHFCPSYTASHTSLKSNLAKNPAPEMKPINSESCCHGDFKNGLGIALT